MPNSENLVPFKKGFDKRRNLQGRPKSLTGKLREVLIDESEQVTSKDITVAILFILDCTESELNELKANENTPYWMKLIINEFMDKNKSFKALESMLDMVFGTNIRTFW